MSFTIDFFDLMFLSESVTGGNTIARSTCFDDFSERHYHNMSDDQRKQFFEYVQKQHGFDLEKEQCKHFVARFNPDNQWSVKTNYNGRIEWIDCYIYNDKYHTSKSRFINPEYILQAKKK
jgi:hypothetical protein